MSAISRIIASQVSGSSGIGVTGNNVHDSVRSSPNSTHVIFVLIVEAGGATPTISWKVQGAMDADAITDANANWFDLLMLPPGSDTVAAIPLVIPSPNATTGVSSPAYIAQATIRFARRFRVVTTANTNVTYRVEMHEKLR